MVDVFNNAFPDSDDLSLVNPESPVVTYPGASSLIDCPRIMGISGFQVQAGIPTSLSDKLTDQNGNLLDKNEGDNPDTLKAYFQPALYPQSDVVQGVGTVSNDGDLLVPVPAAVLDAPGLYRAEFIVFTGADQNPVPVRRPLVSVEPSLYFRYQQAAANSPYTKAGPMTIDRVRLHLRDVPGVAQLVAGHEYSAEEIISSLMRPLEVWNSMPPLDVGAADATTFPYHSQWLDATIGYLLAISGTWYQRQGRQMSFSGGIQEDNRNKAGEYFQLSDKLLTEYKDFVALQKRTLNRSSGASIIGGLGDAYSY